MLAADQFLPDRIININEICRLCRTPRGVMSNIFRSAGIDTSTPLSTRIMHFANIKMCEGDGLPSLICHRCLYHVEQVNEFRQLCQQSDTLLREYIYRVFNTEQNLSQSFSDSDQMDLKSDPEVKVDSEDTSVENIVTHVDPCETYQESQYESDRERDCFEHICPSCNKSFFSKEVLGRHLMIHTQDGPFPCDYCPAESEDKAGLKAHWRMVHGGSNHMCQTCGESFLEKHELKLHQSVHDKVKPHRCLQCGKAFSYKSDLRKHMIIHTGIRPFSCPVCSKTFTRSTNLNKHLRLHTGRRPFTCETCAKMFACKGDLVRHTLIHTGQKPYSCSICSLSFNRKDKLSRHEKVHTVDKAFSCLECPTSFNRKEELTKHIQYHHYSPYMEIAVGTGEEEDYLRYQREVKLSEKRVEFTCEGLECGQGFSSRYQYERHLMDHLNSCNQEFYICDICHKCWRNKQQLAAHIRKNHSASSFHVT